MGVLHYVLYVKFLHFHFPLYTVVCRIMFSPDEDKKVVENVGTTEVCLEVEKNCIGDFQICMNTADGADRDRRAEGTFLKSL